MDTLYSYKNGNYHVTLEADGTKIRETCDPDATEFLPEFPEQMDCKITNNCDMGHGVGGLNICSYCHESSHTQGKHGNLQNTLKVLDCLPQGIEIAIGGGNPLAHPNLLLFLRGLRKMGAVPNLTINELHLTSKYWGLIHKILSSQLAFGIGVSYRSVNKDHSGLYRMMDYPHAIIHLIAGIDDVDDIRGLMKKIKTKKFLLLGFKDFRKGSVYKRKFPEVVERNLRKWYNQLPLFVNEVVNAGGVVSFDNLGIEQLGVRRLMNEDEWNLFFQGAEGTSSFYLDAVKEEFALNSMHPVRYKYLDSVVEMFNHIRNENH